jgi:uncharacterized peroxidase-related enzyme
MAADDQAAFIEALGTAARQPPATLTARERALVRYADTLTLRPSTVTSGDIDALRREGLDDRGIHDACAIVAYFAFVNRIADGLGVELES